jgi:hypothetical protein
MSESKISQSQLKPIYDKLSKGDVVEITYDSSMSRGITKRFKVIKGKTTVGKLRVERITLVNVDKPTSVKYYLYNRNNMITFAHGDMGASIVNIQKENINEGKLSFEDLKKGQVLLNKFRSGRKYTILDVNPKFATIKNLKTGNVMQIYSLNNYELKENSMKLSKLLNENTEPQIITQLRDVMKSGYKTLKDPKSGKKMKVDSYSASAIVNVYDALKDPKNKEKFSSMGLLGMQSTAFKLIK